MLTLDGEYPRPLSDVTLRALALYRKSRKAPRFIYGDIRLRALPRA